MNSPNHASKEFNSPKGDIPNGEKKKESELKAKEKEVDVFEVEDEKSKFPCINSILENNVFSICINLLTIYALFGDDIRVMGFRI
jgi:hypothetical protein